MEFDVGWYAGEGFGAFVVAEDVEFFDARSVYEGAGQSERYVEDAYRFGGLEALVRERRAVACAEVFSHGLLRRSSVIALVLWSGFW